jgi:hypothetical protein
MTSIGCKNDTPVVKTEKINRDTLTESAPKQVITTIDTAKFIEGNKYSGKYAFLNSNLLHKEDFEYMSPLDLRIVRNEIFARYSYIFKSKDLQDYFAKTDWYKPLLENVDKYLTVKEKQNIDSLKKYESINKEINQTDQFNIFLDLIRNKKEIPLLIAQKYNCNRTDYGPFTSIDTILFDYTKEYKYLLTHDYSPCDQCYNVYYIVKYSLDGEKMDIYTLNDDYGIIGGEMEKIEKMGSTGCKMTFVHYNYSDFDEEDDNSGTETEQKPDYDTFLVKIDKSENLTISKQ